MKTKLKVFLIGFLVFCISQIIAMAADIDIGITTVRSSTYPSLTMVQKTNPANASGTITEIQIYAETELANCEVATFTAAGDNMTTRDSEIVNNGNGAGVVITGSLQTFVVDLDVVAGDYIGIYFSAGAVYRDSSGGDGRWWKSGDNIPCSGVAFTSESGKRIDLYGEGILPAAFALEEFNAVVCTKWNGLAILEWNATSIP